MAQPPSAVTLDPEPLNMTAAGRKRSLSPQLASTLPLAKHQHRLPPRPSNISGPPSDPSPSNWHLRLADRSAARWTAQRPPQLLQQPEQITSFSYDERRQLHHDDRSRTHFHYPPPGVDLNRGFDSYVRRDETKDEHLDSLLWSLMDLADRYPEADRARQRADVITWRGMMTKLCTLLYEDSRDGGFAMNAMLVNDTLYIEEHVTAADRQSKVDRNDPSSSTFDHIGSQLQYHGAAFESWCTHTERPQPFDYQRDDPWGGDVNTNVQWCRIVKSRLGTTARLILGGEVDCISTPTHSGNAHRAPQSLELKTTMTIRNQRDTDRFERKMLRFYMQSYLLGIERVFVGFRNRAGKLESTHDFETLAMPKLVKGKREGVTWDTTACLNAAAEILGFLLKTIRSNEKIRRGGAEAGADGEKGDMEPAVYRVRFAPPYDAISVAQVSSTEANGTERPKDGSKGDDEPRVGFMPKKYYDWAIRQPRVYQ